VWTLRRKILSGYVVALGLAGLLLGIALLNIVRLGSASDAILQENYRSILAAEEMLNALAEQENAAMQMVIGLEEHNVTRFSDAERQFLLWLERAKANVTIDREPEILTRIETAYGDFLFQLAKFRNIYQGDHTKGLRFYQEQLAPQATAVREACRQLHDLNRQTMEAGSLRAQNVARTAVWTMLAVGVIVISGAMMASIWLSNRIVRPVQILTEATERVASGTYDVDIKPGSQDEVGQLARKFNVMLTKLRAYHDLNLRRIVGEQKKAEVILQTIDDGVLVIGPDRKVMTLNLTAAKLLGIHARGVEGRDFTEIVEDERLSHTILESLKSKQAPQFEAGSAVIFVGGPDDHQAYFEYTLTPVTGADGDLIGVIVLFRNITAMKELDRLKTEFVMTASHELRSPLTSIAMSIGLLRERASTMLDESGKHLLDVAHEELERLRALVEELLDLSKIQSGRLEIEFADVSIPMVLEAAVVPFRVQAQELGIDLTLKVPRELPTMRADPNKLAWVVTNLVGNALRYAKTRVEVSAEKAGPWMLIYVRDDGVGIPYDQQARIFEKFVCIPSDKRPGGAGLGLAISKEVVKAHHGNITVESEPGKGSLFIVSLPLPS
jgi:NtrC-family two-component system sensor histidine kinase KinB